MAVTLATIRADWRNLTGRHSTNDISDSDVDARINEYMRLHLPYEINFDSLLADWTQATSPYDDGEYSLGQDVLDLNPPLFADDTELVIYEDRELFFRDFPPWADEDFITPPTLAIGTASTAKVASAAFTYKIGDYAYDKSAAETALSGSTVPQNKWGAWLLYIDDDGTISVSEAASNATGYDTPAKAIDGITLPGSSYAIMGLVLAKSTDAGGFIPGTTELDDAAVTDHYVDGNPSLRAAPTYACVAGGKLFIRPKPDETYYLRATLSLSRPSTLSGDSDTVSDDVLAKLIAVGAAIAYLAERGDEQRVVELVGNAKVPGTLEYLKAIVSRKRLRQEHARECRRQF